MKVAENAAWNLANILKIFVFLKVEGKTVNLVLMSFVYCFTC
jgi:hypothetical protein